MEIVAADNWAEKLTCLKCLSAGFVIYMEIVVADNWAEKLTCLKCLSARFVIDIMSL